MDPKGHTNDKPERNETVAVRPSEVIENAPKSNTRKETACNFQSDDWHVSKDTVDGPSIVLDEGPKAGWYHSSGEKNENLTALSLQRVSPGKKRIQDQETPQSPMTKCPRYVPATGEAEVAGECDNGEDDADSTYSDPSEFLKDFWKAMATLMHLKNDGGVTNVVEDSGESALRGNFQASPEKSTEEDSVEESEKLVLLNAQDVVLYKLPESSEVGCSWSPDKPFWLGTILLFSCGTSWVIKLEEDSTEGLFGFRQFEDPQMVLTTSLVRGQNTIRFFTFSFIKNNEVVHKEDTEETVGLAFASQGDALNFLRCVQALRVPKEKNKPRIPRIKRSAKDRALKSLETLHTNSSHIRIPPGGMQAYVLNGLRRFGNFPCRLCPANFDDARHMQFHWGHVHDLKSKLCPVCHIPFIFDDDRWLPHVHTKICPGCNLEIPGQDLPQHLKEAHSGYKLYRCWECRENYYGNTPEFWTFTQLKEHQRLHHLPSLYQCPECLPKLVYLMPEEIPDHKAFHGNQFLYCHLCEAGFSLPQDLKKHRMLVHYRTGKNARLTLVYFDSQKDQYLWQSF